MRGIASTGLQRPSIAPDLPTVAESGLDGFDMRMWFGLMAPNGTPDDIVENLSRAAAEALKSDAVKDRARQAGL